MAFSDKTHTQYGGNSSCTVLDIDGHIVVLDCGSGLFKFYMDNTERFKSAFKLDILLSHLHLDHIIGFSMFPPVLSPDSDIRIFTRSRNDNSLVSQVFEPFKPPNWPVNIADVTKAKMIEIIDEKPFALGDGITVTPFFTELHNQTSVFRIDAEKSVVYLSDYEIQENMDKHEKLIAFCQNSDLVILDTCFMSEDYPSRRGWGHSTIEDGKALARASGCKKMVFSHISPMYADMVLADVQEGLDDSRFQIAFDGMEMEI